MPLGILNSGGTITINRKTAGTIAVEDVVNMYCRLPASSLDTAAWFCNSDCLPKLLTLVVETWNSPLTDRVGSSAPIFLQAGTLAGKPFNTLLGLPVIFIEQAETLGSTADLILADWSRYISATRGVLRTDSSIHVRFEYSELAIRFQYRLDGQPERNTPLQPFKGSNTTSPFCILGPVA
jgi:HK97 family phage major capsid protein